MTLSSCVEWLIKYGLENDFFEKEDERYIRNQLMAILKCETLENDLNEVDSKKGLHDILDFLLNYCDSNGMIPNGDRDLVDSKIMGAMLARPSDIQKNFHMYFSESPEKATSYFYNLCLKSNYIRKDRTDKNKIWYYDSKYGRIQMTINVSKPEKDPKQIEAEKKAPKKAYPKCLLCIENEGYHGRVNHPARQNLRLIPLLLNGEAWFFQYSPYLYYNEHAIVIRDEHVPMKISSLTFQRMLSFVDLFPHYFIGSNADLPIVGGSILSHDHYQAGHHTFPMALAECVKKFSHAQFPAVKAYWINWPMSVIRLKSSNHDSLVKAAEAILKTWQEYDDKSVEIHAFTGETPHNTVTPIARKNNNFTELDIVLRNNRTTKDYPHGLFHPHEEVHAIKRENIGLIEVMGLAILPPRLLKETELIEALLNGEKLSEEEWLTIEKHEPMIELIKNSKGELTLDQAIGELFEKALIDAGVYKDTDEGRKAFMKFMKTCGYEEEKE